MGNQRMFGCVDVGHGSSRIDYFIIALKVIFDPLLENIDCEAGRDFPVMAGKILIDPWAPIDIINSTSLKGENSMAQDHKCQICGAEFHDEAKLEDHNRTMHSQYTCEVCSQVFPSKSDWETHVRDMHLEREGSITR